MSGSFKILTWKGVGLYMHWTFFLLVGYIILSSAAFGHTAESLIWSLFFLAAFFICITLHEFGHAFVASRFGIHATQIVLLPIGGVANMEKFPENPKQELAISIAGPLTNVLIAALIWLLLPAGLIQPVVTGEPQIIGMINLLHNLMIINIWLAIFNMIPAFPMDGGRVIRALLAFRLNYVRATKIASIIGKFIATLFIFLGILVMNPFLPLIGLFIIFSANTEEYYLQLKSLVKDVRLIDVIMHDYASLDAAMNVEQAVNTVSNNDKKYFLLLDQDMPIGTLHRVEMIKAAADKRYAEPLRNLPYTPVKCMEGSVKAGDVLEELSRNADRVIPVLKDGKFAGVVSLSHIIEYQMLHNTQEKAYPGLKNMAGLLR